MWPAVQAIFKRVGRRWPWRNKNFPRRWRARSWSFFAASRARTEIPQRFVRGIRHPHRGQVAGAVAARQFLGVPSIGLDPITGLRRHQRGRHDVAVRAEAVSCQYRT